MIKRLRLKFMAITMGILFIVLLFIIGGINLTMYNSSQMQSYRMMQDIVNANLLKVGSMPPPNKPKERLPIPSIIIHLDTEGTILNVIQNRSTESLDTIVPLVDKLFHKEKTYGHLENYSFLKEETSYGKIIVLLDRSLEYELLKNLFIRSTLIGLASFIGLSFVTYLLSGWAIKPVAIAFEKQQRFIADASHELKTPVAVIATNAKVLEGEIGENKWLSYIQEQTERMRVLTLELLSLARVETGETLHNFSLFDLSQSLLNETLSFECVAFEEAKTLTIDIEEHLMLNGDESAIKQLVAILLDNAIKHTPKKGHINVSLHHKGRKHFLSIYNSDSQIPESELSKVFERFYRVDKSRSRETGGYGLGLSIAKAITEHHAGHITLTNKDQGVLVTVALPS